MQFHLSQSKAVSFNALTQAYCNYYSFILGTDHVQNCLVDKDILLLHLFYQQLEGTRQFNTVVKLWELDHLSLFNVNAQTSWLVEYLRVRDLISFLFGKLGYLIK